LIELTHSEQCVYTRQDRSDRIQLLFIITINTNSEDDSSNSVLGSINGSIESIELLVIVTISQEDVDLLYTRSSIGFCHSVGVFQTTGNTSRTSGLNDSIQSVHNSLLVVAVV
jgi:hypothetical protein